MQRTRLGRTGLEVSRVGLGCGGPSRLGQSYGHSLEASKRVIFRALELGIDFFDTAESYGTEAVLGAALREAGRQHDVVVSTKKGVWDSEQKRFTSPSEFQRGIEACLERLGRDRIEVFHLHGLDVAHVDYAVGEIVPVLLRAREAGKIGHLAVSEAFMSDTEHRMLRRALELDVFDVMMVGFNLLNPSARKTVLPHTRRLDVGVLIMFAVRRALTNPARLAELIEGLISRAELDPGAVDRQAALAFLGDARDAGYRFCMHEPGADLVLTGTGDPEHLEQNVRSLSAPALPREQLERLERLFGDVVSVSAH
ncbi:MAG TPA: aldo/keto reductase [Polyangiaceae bacterium]|nr:aldo/keto reductase [Polyangiaceae bacterium]